MENKISIIIPCYNVESYINKCLESVVNQTIGLDKLEIILVNDASTDDTYLKLLEWEQRYPDNIMVISYEENLRQGGARNIGLTYATGRYIGFVDSDDWIDIEMYKILLQEMVEGDYDAVYCRIVRTDDAGNAVSEPWYGGVVSGIYQRNIIIDNDIFFPEHVSYEDNYWMRIVRIYARNTKKIDYTGYYYRINPNSTIMARNNYNHLERLQTEEMLVETYRERGYFEEYKTVLMNEFMNVFYINTLFLLFTRFDNPPNMYAYICNKIDTLFPTWDTEYKYTGGNPIEETLIYLLYVRQELSDDEWKDLQIMYLSALQNNRITDYINFIKKISN